MNHRLTIKKSLALALTMMLTLALLLAVVTPTLAAENKGVSGRNGSIAPSPQQGPTDPAEMEAFLDDLLGKEMAEHHIAGAAVAVVKQDQLFFTKGYGYADLEHKIPVDAEQTMFRLGSVTKLFTWTAVMQLVEQGKLNLDADVNTYLDFRIPDTYPQPITLKHLLTHTAGFEDLHVDIVKLKEAELAPPHTWLVSHLPARVRPPGERAAYSNYGAALAGYIVARVAGQSYSQYVQEHILNPLGMKRSTAQWPIPEDLSAHESVGYMYANGAYQVFPRLLSPEDFFPAGIICASVADMAHFMIAHLQDGRYSDASYAEARILKEATAQQMHSTLYTPDPRILGATYGFFDFSDNGQRVIGHSGTAEPMHSLLLLLPDQNLGVFVAYNSQDADELARQHFGFQRAFFDHYYPAPALKPIQPPEDFAERADRFVGAYKWTLSSYTTLEKYLALMGPTVYVKNPGDGTLLLASPYGDWRAVEEEPLYFRQVDGPYHFAFREDAQGQLTYVFTDYTPMMAFEKVQWYETLNFNLPLLLVSLLLFLSMLFVALLGAFRNRRTGSDQNPAPRSARMAYWLVVGISVLNLLFVAGNVLWGEQLAFGIALIYKAVLGLGVLSAVLTVGALVYAVLAWKDNYWGVVFRSYYTLVIMAAVAFVWFLNTWNLLGWRF
ncbi:MAG: serine hydrolase domain-containing protein [Caldilineaceae bacterium]